VTGDCRSKSMQTCLYRGLLLSKFPIKILHAFLSRVAPCTAHTILLYFNTPKIIQVLWPKFRTHTDPSIHPAIHDSIVLLLDLSHFFSFLILYTVGIATGYGLDDREAGVRVPVGSRILTSPCLPDRLWGSPTLLSNGYWGLFPRG
jgi:hypothetical protein